MSIGRLAYQKGFDLGIEVIEKLCKEGYAIKWYIIGEGNQRTELEQKIIGKYLCKRKYSASWTTDKPLSLFKNV